MPPLKPGDRVDAVYLAKDGQIKTATNREVVRIERRPDIGIYRVTVDLPDDAADDRQNTYLTDSQLRTDYLRRASDADASEPGEDQQDQRGPGGA